MDIDINIPTTEPPTTDSSDRMTIAEIDKDMLKGPDVSDVLKDNLTYQPDDEDIDINVPTATTGTIAQN